MLVYVLDKERKPLMPTKPAIARLLLKEGKAKVVKRMPFTIKMLVETTSYKQEIIAGMDTGSKVIGIACVSNGKVLYKAETFIRQDVSEKMQRRRMYRRNRRSRKTRYREARWSNRANSFRKDRLAPSLLSKLNSHLREKKFIEKLLPITQWILELASFDIHKISNPNVINYQKGQQKGFYNVKAFILNRDDHTCQHCKSKNKKLHVHHIIFKSNGGTDSPENLITLCEDCHKDLHENKFVLKGIKSKTKQATEIGIIKSQLKKKFGEFVESFGYETKFKREQILHLEKTHYNDAISICCEDGEIIEDLNYYFIKKNISKGDYQQTKGIRSEKKIPTSKLFGFKKFDKVKTPEGTGFIKGKRSSGAFVIMDILGSAFQKSWNAKKYLERISARKNYMIERLSVAPIQV
jgi:5-methylcytosine-specific restriction endonuclease McrA